MTQTVSLGDFVDISSSKRIFYSEYVDKGVPFYRSKEIIEKATGSDVSTPLFISEDRFNEIRAKFGAPKPGDLLLTSVGTLGISYIVKNGEEFYFKDGNLTWFRNFHPDLDRDYLFYWLTSDQGKKELERHTIGSTQKALTIQGLKKIKLLLPDVDTQKRTARFLRSIDEKIELNRRMNETLEQMGQALFRHYFIANPNAKEWEKGKLEQLVDLNKHSIGKDYEYDEILYVDITSVSTGSIDRVESVELAKAPSRAKRIVQSGDIIWATVRPNRRAYSLVLDPPKNLVVSTGFAVMSPKEDALGYCYYYTSSQVFGRYLTLHARGAAYPAVTSTDFKNAPILIPDLRTLKKFENLVLPSLKLISNLKQEVQTLTALRDILLPRLISGKVKVR